MCRHGWGCPQDPDLAVTYLSAAASNSASIESQALQAGMKKGGAAKGELVLAIFELGNCFRNGWGVRKDPAAARQYFETAANLGDTDAMNETAWCYLEGFGGKKDKVSGFLVSAVWRIASCRRESWASIPLHKSCITRALCPSLPTLLLIVTNRRSLPFSMRPPNTTDWPKIKATN